MALLLRSNIDNNIIIIIVRKLRNLKNLMLWFRKPLKRFRQESTIVKEELQKLQHLNRKVIDLNWTLKINNLLVIISHLINSCNRLSKWSIILSFHIEGIGRKIEKEVINIRKRIGCYWFGKPSKNSRNRQWSFEIDS